MKHIRFAILFTVTAVVVVTSGCCLFERSLVVEKHPNFVKKRYTKFYNEEGYAYSIDYWKANKINYTFSSENIDNNTCRISCTLQEGFIFPPTFFHNPFWPIFWDIRKEEYKIYDAKQPFPFAEIEFYRGVFRSEITPRELYDALDQIFYPPEGPTIDRCSEDGYYESSDDLKYLNKKR